MIKCKRCGKEFKPKGGSKSTYCPICRKIERARSMAYMGNPRKK